MGSKFHALGTMNVTATILLVILFVCGLAVDTSQTKQTPTNSRRTIPPTNGGMFGKRSVILPLVGRDNAIGAEENGSDILQQYQTRFDVFVRATMNRCLQDQRLAGQRELLAVIMCSEMLPNLMDRSLESTREAGGFADPDPISNWLNARL